MCARTSSNENRILTLSALLASGFAGGGLLVGLLVGSLVIFFDGVYSLVSVLLTILSLAASRYIQRPDDTAFPFGKAVLEPAVIALKGLVILGIVAYSLYSAVLSIMDGGRDVDTSLAALFGIVNVIGCGSAWWFMAVKSRRYSSGLIDAEVGQWQMDAMLSIAVTLGFVIAWVLLQTPLAPYAAYADPMMMLVMSFYLVKVPFNMLKVAMRELLMMSPSHEICKTVDQDVMAVSAELDQWMELTGVTKVGQELWVNVDISADDNSEVILVEDIENARRSLKRRLSRFPLKLQLTMSIAG
jgi:cation diffusion facilitator family transporter